MKLERENEVLYMTFVEDGTEVLYRTTNMYLIKNYHDALLEIELDCVATNKGNGWVEATDADKDEYDTVYFSYLFDEGLIGAAEANGYKVYGTASKCRGEDFEEMIK